MTLLNRAVFPVGPSLLEQLAKCNRHEQEILAALIATPDDFGKRIWHRDIWLRDLAKKIDGKTAEEKADLIHSSWKRYLTSARWRKDRETQLLPLGTEFPFWHLHVISKFHKKSALCRKQILKIIK